VGAWKRNPVRSDNACSMKYKQISCSLTATQLLNPENKSVPVFDMSRMTIAEIVSLLRLLAEWERRELALLMQKGRAMAWAIALRNSGGLEPDEVINAVARRF
jgi:hypothetical protein